MLVELLSDSSFVKYNIELANKIGLHEAIYLNIIIDINMKAIKKGKVNESYFTIDREYVKSITTFEYAEQAVIEEALQRAGIIDIQSSGQSGVTLQLNMKVLTALFMTEGNEIDEKINKDLRKIINAKSQNNKTKSDFIVDAIMKSLDIKNGELREAFAEWAKSVIQKRGWINKELSEIALHRINEYTNRNLDMAIDILKIATANGWYNIDWAIKSYIEMSKTMSITDRPAQQITITKERKVYN